MCVCVLRACVQCRVVDMLAALNAKKWKNCCTMNVFQILLYSMALRRKLAV